MHNKRLVRKLQNLKLNAIFWQKVTGGACPLVMLRIRTYLLFMSRTSWWLKLQYVVKPQCCGSGFGSVYFGPLGSGSVVIYTDPDPSINKQNKVRQTLISTVFWHFIFEVNVFSNRNKLKNFGKKLFLPLTKKAESRSESVSQWYWYGTVDPFQYHNVTDQQHCYVGTVSTYASYV